MGALYAWCCMCYADASLIPSHCGWRIVVESASEIINSAKITQKVSTLLPPQELLSLRFDYNF
ncbi:Uncharacterised protein [Salmonella enterica subsp. enterica serovar Bovismorbificans]|uniref:Uncharacterized protein n=1 Tax=Salmonella enterica subsp. enterica serovar Bovismorbificans TaxID=58097 RepID=A0A379NDQ4_SALET|nr:Uncharacterised protein [Salmonella enterica subsp. enterica serovar Bovismorbificans]